MFEAKTSTTEKEDISFRVSNSKDYHYRGISYDGIQYELEAKPDDRGLVDLTIRREGIPKEARFLSPTMHDARAVISSLCYEPKDVDYVFKQYADLPNIGNKVSHSKLLDIIHKDSKLVSTRTMYPSEAFLEAFRAPTKRCPNLIPSYQS
ncbi:hypothetical protein GOV06_01190 [Candidatus Woesearchaeota archaeon]|nr:hypothetical protein [Candidatus Woesearchaeota archaeon]